MVASVPVSERDDDGFDSPAQRVVDVDTGFLVRWAGIIGLYVDGCEDGVGEGAANGPG
jgi:hypothetical protein